jgi:hypothetical protein
VVAVPEPVLPDFGGACLSNVVGSLFAALAGAPDSPEWLPEPLRHAQQIVLLVLDGLGYEQLAERASLAPTLHGVLGAPITSVAPSTTACALTSLVTGLPPAAHGVLGYRVAMGDAIMNVLGWRVGEHDARQDIPPQRFQPHRAFPGAPGEVPVVTRADYAPTGFSAAHLGDARLVGWHTPSGIVVEVRRLVAEGWPFVYAYYDGIDRISHAKGLGEHYDAELAGADRLVGDLLSVLPPGAVLAVTADHGQVDVGPNAEVIGPDVMAGVTLISGEGRFRWLHAAPGATEDVAEAAHEAFSEIAWVRTREAVIEEGWLGGEPGPRALDTLGDVALVPFVPTAFLDPADTGELRLAARHGSLTPAEMLVPFVALTP